MILPAPASMAAARNSGLTVWLRRRLARRYLGEPLRSFQIDDEMFEGIGQIEVEFLGDRFVLGCVEGEEDRAISLAHRLEVAAGEVLKAVIGELDHTRSTCAGR